MALRQTMEKVHINICDIGGSNRNRYEELYHPTYNAM
jgi:hypothetical protein